MQRRLWKEIRELLDDGEEHGVVVTGITAELAALNPTPGSAAVAVFNPKTARKQAGAQEGSELVALRCDIVGEAGTTLEGGRWEVEIFPPRDYPFAPCTFHLTTPCFHADVPLPPEHDAAEALDVDALQRRVRAAREVLSGGTAAGTGSEESSDSAHAKLTPPTMTLTFQALGSAKAVEVPVAADDTVADLKLRCKQHVDLEVPLEGARLIHRGQELKNDCGAVLSSCGVQDKDTIHVVHRLFAAPCGPFAILEGRCESCREKFSPHSPAVTIMKTLVQMRHYLHDYRGLRATMEAEVGIDKFELSWSPWVAIYEPCKVRNLQAGVLLAEGNLLEYEKQVVAFRLKFAHAGEA